MLYVQRNSKLNNPVTIRVQSVSEFSKTFQLNHPPSDQDNAVVAVVVAVVYFVVGNGVFFVVGVIPVCAPSFQDFQDDDVLDVGVLDVGVVVVVVYGMVVVADTDFLIWSCNHPYVQERISSPILLKAF